MPANIPSATPRSGFLRRATATFVATLVTVFFASVFAGPAPVAARFVLTRVAPPDVARLGGDFSVVFRPALRGVAGKRYIAVAHPGESIQKFRDRVCQGLKVPHEEIRASEPLTPAYVAVFPRVHRTFACGGCGHEAAFDELKRDPAYAMEWLPELAPRAHCPACDKRTVWRAVERDAGGPPRVYRFNPPDITKIRDSQKGGPEYAWKVPDYAATALRRGESDAVANSPPGFADAVRRDGLFPLDPRVFRIVP